MKTPEGYTTEARAHNGPILGILVIILVLILGGLYLWGSMLDSQNEVVETPIVNNEPETPRAEADVEIMQTLSPSDELSAIEADITNTNLDTIDADIQAMDAETEPVFAE